MKSKNILLKVFIFAFLVTYFHVGVIGQGNTQSEEIKYADEILLKIKDELNSNNPDSAYYYSDKLIIYAISEGLPYFEAIASYYAGNCFQSMGNKDSAIYYLNRSLIYFNDTHDTIWQGKTNARIAVSYKLHGSFDTAIIYYDKALNYLTLPTDTLWNGALNDNLGMIYFRQGNYFMALDHIQKAITAFLLIDHKINVGNEYNTMGVIYRKTNDKDKEKAAYLNAINILEKTEESSFLGMAYNNLAEIYIDEGQIDLAFETLEKAKNVYINTRHELGLCSYYSVLTYYYINEVPPNYEKVKEFSIKSMLISDEYNDYRQYADASSYLGEAYYNTNELNKAFEVLEKGLFIAEKYKLKPEIVKITRDLANMYDEIDQPKKALGYLNKHLIFKDSISGEEKIKEFTSLDLKFKFKQQQIKDSIEQLRKEQDMNFAFQMELQIHKQTKLIFIFLSVLILIIAIFIFIYSRKTRNQSLLLNIKNKEIEKSLYEKELLLKEVHHRVKNNFQTVSSLLELQARDIQDEKVLRNINDSKSRIKAMALIHQKLYQSENIAVVNIQEYIEQLANQCAAMYLFDDFEMVVNANDIKLDIDTAIPLGLIINELVTNAFKYAFSPKRKNLLNISLGSKDESSFVLSIKDNGSGLPVDLETLKTDSIGLWLAQRLTKQLHGSFAYKYNNGSIFKITFKDTLHRKQIE